MTSDMAMLVVMSGEKPSLVTPRASFWGFVRPKPDGAPITNSIKAYLRSLLGHPILIRSPCVILQMMNPGSERGVLKFIY